jgi:hypothetical protein
MSLLTTNAQLAAELDQLGVYFLRSNHQMIADSRIAPNMLMAMLAASNEARLRLALIPLLLRHPLWATYAEAAQQHLPIASQIVFKCYYTAAWLLQQKYQSKLMSFTDHWVLLPDLYSNDLALCHFADPDQGLHQLAERHRILSGRSINWLGTYEHAAQRWLTHMEWRRLWNS